MGAGAAAAVLLKFNCFPNDVPMLMGWGPCCDTRGGSGMDCYTPCSMKRGVGGGWEGGVGDWMDGLL